MYVNDLAMFVQDSKYCTWDLLFYFHQYVNCKYRTMEPFLLMEQKVALARHQRGKVASGPYETAWNPPSSAYLHGTVIKNLHKKENLQRHCCTMNAFKTREALFEKQSLQFCDIGNLSSDPLRLGFFKLMGLIAIVCSQLLQQQLQFTPGVCIMERIPSYPPSSRKVAHCTRPL